MYDPLCGQWADSYYKNGQISFETIDPANLEFLNPRIDELKSWKWIFGNTPKFQLETGEFTILVNKGGIIETVQMSNGVTLPNFEGIQLCDDLRKSNVTSKTENEFLSLILDVI